MKIKLLIIGLIFSIQLNAQPTKKIEIKHKNPDYSEIYFVLKSNKSIKHGKYEKLNSANKIIVTGLYKNGNKDSIWNFYNNGELEQAYNFTSNKLISDNSKQFIYNILCDSLKAKSNIIPPIYIGGRSQMNLYIAENLTYPNSAKENGVNGQVIISLIVDTNGTVNNCKIKKGIGSGCDEIALKIVQNIPNSWIPANYLGNPLKSEIEIPINFNISY